MFKAAVRVNKITTLAQLRGATLHAERADETSRARLREGAEPGAGLAWSKAENDRDYLGAFKAHKLELEARERKGAPLCLQALCVVSPEWVKDAGDLHDPQNPRNRALFAQAKEWAESWAGKGAVFGARLDLDEAGGAVVDLMISPVRESRGKPVISTQKALVELKAATGERNEYSALQTSWAEWSKAHLDEAIERGTRREITRREHLSPETYGLVRDQARTEAAQELALAPDVVRTLHSASEMAPEAIDELRGLLLLRRELQAHRRDPKGYTAPGAHDLHSKLLDDPEGEPWPIITRVRRDAENIIETAHGFGMDMNDDQKGYAPGAAFFPALTDRIHLTTVLAKCADFCARAEAFVKHGLAQLRGLGEALPDHRPMWPPNAQGAIERNERNLGLRATEAKRASEHTAQPSARGAFRDRDSGWEL